MEIVSEKKTIKNYLLLMYAEKYNIYHGKSHDMIKIVMIFFSRFSRPSFCDVLIATCTYFCDKVGRKWFSSKHCYA